MMAENSGIEWTHHTFNPWIGCTKVSPACDNCYAEVWNKRFDGGANWGPKAQRRRTKNWNNPIKWNREAEAKGVRYRVFCASLADVFDNKVPDKWRNDLWELIRKTQNLDWLLLTKRPQNIERMLPGDWNGGYRNVWLGTTVENQEECDRRLPILLEIPAAIRFLSCEPLLGRVDIFKTATLLCQKTGALADLHWIIAGGESGDNFRHMQPDWVRLLRNSANLCGIAFLFKQWEGKNQKEIKSIGRDLDGVVWDQYPKKNDALGGTVE